MPRLFHRPPKYCLHRGTKQAYVSVDGSRVYLGPYGSERSHEAYRRFLAKWKKQRHKTATETDKKKAEERLAAVINPAALRQKWREGLKVSIDELIFVYRQHARAYYVKNGVVTREAELITEITELLGKKHGQDRIDDFGPLDLENFRDGLIDAQDWSRLFLNKQTVRIVAMFKWGAQKELCSPLVYQQLGALGGLKKGRTRARESEGVQCVADELIDKTLAALPPIVADMVRLQRLTGARPGEVCALRPCDMQREGAVWLYRPDSHKTEHHDKTRVIAFGPQAQQLVAPYLERAETSYCFSPAESERLRHQARTRKTPESCGNRAGSNRVTSPKRSPRDCYDVSAYRHAIRRACEKLALPIWAPNQLRHTAATNIRKQFGLEAAQVVCGHSRADVTQIYAERDLQLAMRVAEAVG